MDSRVESTTEVTIRNSEDNTSEIECRDKTKGRKSKEANRKSSDSDEPILKEENWMNQNEDIKKSNKNHIKAHRSVNSILNVEQNGCEPIPFLLNGGKSLPVSSIPEIYSTQTCSFDSIYQLIVANYADSPKFKRFVDEDPSDFAKFLQLGMNLNKKNKVEFDALRNHILTKMFPDEVKTVGKMLSVDCETVITNTYKKLCEQFPLLFSMQTHTNCCSDISVVEFVRFRLNRIDVRNVHKTIIPMKLKQRCRCCKQLSNLTHIPQDIIAFDTEGAVENVSLADIQTNLVVESLRFELLGVVEHKSSNKHFIARVRRNNTWFTFDDLNPPAKISTLCVQRLVLILYRCID